MHFLLVLRQNKNLEAFLGVVRSLLDRGHRVTVAVQEWDDARDERVVEALQSERFAMVPCPPARLDGWASAATLIRSLRDCAHYLHPSLRGATKLQGRTVEKLRQKMMLPARPQAVTAFLRSLTPAQVQEWETVLALAESNVPSDALLDEFVAGIKPDVILISPLIHFGSAQADVVATAQRLGIRHGMLLYSWDNLSTKGCLHRMPERMFVWNEQQREEAGTLHGFPPDRVVVVGAPRFDDFFALSPVLSRDVFHEGLGLDPAQPTLLYVCSSRFVTKEELPFVRRWIAGIRASDEPLRSANIIVRPHPDIGLLPGDVPVENRKIGQAEALRVRIARPFDDPRAVVVRTSLATPRGLFESIFHSAAVVGLNTTAELEAGIVGRPVFTTLAGDDDADGQQSTLHFHYLLKERGGFVDVAQALPDHLAQLATAVRTPPDSAAIRRFIESFLRPHGLEKPVAPIYAAAIEREYVGASSGQATATAAAPGPAAPLRIEVRAPAGAQAVAAEPPLDDELVAWVEESVGIGDVVYDIGAGTGLLTVLAAKRRGAVVVAFEAGYASFAQLCENIRLNGCQDHVIPLPVALSDEDGLKELKYEEGREGVTHRLAARDWRVKPIHSDRMYVQPVCVSPLDAIVGRHRLPTPHHIRIGPRIDVRKLLEGARRTLASAGLKSVVVDDSLASDTIDIPASVSYTVWRSGPRR